MTRIVTAALSAMTAVAISATAIAGLVGWHPALASAAPAPEPVTLFGVNQATAVALGPAVPTEDKFDDASAGTIVSLDASAEKRRTAIVKTAPKPAVKAKKPAKKKMAAPAPAPMAPAAPAM